MIRRLLDRLLGGRCRLGCGQRVYPRDTDWHEHLEHLEHAGDVA